MNKNFTDYQVLPKYEKFPRTEFLAKLDIATFFIYTFLQNKK